MRSVFVGCLVLGVFFLSRGAAWAEDQKDGVLNDSATIIIQDGESKVTLGDVQMMMKDMTPEQRARLLSDKSRLQELLYSDIVLQKKVFAAKKQKLEQQSLAKWKLEKARQNVLAGMLEKDWLDNLDVTKDFTALAQEYYDSHPEEFEVAEKIKAAHILFRVDVENEQQLNERRVKAEQVLEEIKNKELEFAEAAKKYSDDQGSAKSGGELGYFSRGHMVKSFEEAAFQLQAVDDMSALVQTRFGLHIIKLLDREPARRLTFDDVKDRLLEKQRRSYIKSAHQQFLSGFDIDQETTTLHVPVFEQLYQQLRAATAAESGQ